MYVLIKEWRRPNDCRVTKVCGCVEEIAEGLAGLALALRRLADESGTATVILTLKDKSAAGRAARRGRKR